ncbi:MAG: hypothetical protein HY078_02890 [Elusimicrobia bacterium]|nr:hypothetical protein [Elusimicrobiota bacterium]
MSAAGRAPKLLATVAQIRDETPSVKAFRLSLPEGVPFPFTPGQFVMVNFPSEPENTRAYSLASSPLEAGFVEIAFAKAGAFTARMFDLKVGDTLGVEGPYGKWIYKEDPHAVLISGGTGITPFRSIIRYAADKRLPRKITLIYSARSAAEIIFAKDLEAWASLPNVNTVVTVTRPQEPSSSGWKGRTGRIGIDLIRESVPDSNSATFYLCGPNALVSELSGVLGTAGVPRERIRYEKWGEF